MEYFVLRVEPYWNKTLLLLYLSFHSLTDKVKCILFVNFAKFLAQENVKQVGATIIILCKALFAHICSYQLRKFIRIN